MTPFVYQFLKLAALMPKRVSQVRFGKMSILAVMSYSAAILLRDDIYWPIVQEIYGEINSKNVKRAYQCQQALTLMQT